MWTVRWEELVILQLCRWTFHTRKLCSRHFCLIETKFYFLNRFLSHPLEDLRPPSIVRWKARCRLPIHHNWTFLAISYGWDVISGNVSRRGRVTLSANFRRKEQSPPTIVGVRKLEWLPFFWYQNIHTALFSFVTKHVCDSWTELRLPCSVGTNSEQSYLNRIVK